MSRPNFAQSGTMQRALAESFTDQQAIDHAEDIQLGRDVDPDEHGWRRGQDEWENAYWCSGGDAA